VKCRVDPYSINMKNKQLTSKLGIMKCRPQRPLTITWHLINKSLSLGSYWMARKAACMIFNFVSDVADNEL